MPQCLCRTRKGVQCKFNALTGSDFCRLHQACRGVSSDDTSEEVDALALLATAKVADLASLTRELKEERDFYYAKLFEIERLADADASALAARILGVLRRPE